MDFKILTHLTQGVYDESNAVYDAIAKTYLGDTWDSGNFTEMMPGLIDVSHSYRNFSR